MDSLYTMKLHDQYSFDRFEVTRVAGGWIYVYFEAGEGGCQCSSVFVPYNNEFQRLDEHHL